MRWVVDGCKPVFSLISFSEIASSRDAKTSISANMRSITWMTGTAGTSDWCFLMGNAVKPAAILLGEMGWRSPAALDQQFMRGVAGLVVHLGAALDPVAEIDMGEAQLARLIDLPQHAVVAVTCARL